jgi:hypothetical protein
MTFLAKNAALGIILLCGGCASFMRAPPYEVSVDAISGATGVGGTSYQLAARDVIQARDGAAHAKAFACVEAALADKAMFEAPAKTVPDIFITVDYGLGNTIPALAGPPMVEKYIYLVARKTPENSVPKGEELWNVRVTVSVPPMSIEAALPLLAVVAADYIGTDTQVEKVIKIPSDSPALLRVQSISNGTKITP